MRQESDRERLDLLLLFTERMRKPQDDRDLREFRGLKRDRTESQPTRSAATRSTESCDDGDEQERRNDLVKPPESDENSPPQSILVEPADCIKVAGCIAMARLVFAGGTSMAC